MSVPKAEIYSRISRLQKELKVKGSIGTILVQNVDVYYYSGTFQNSHLFIPAEGEPILFVKKSLKRGQAESPLEQILPLNSLRELPKTIEQMGHTLEGQLGLELDVIPYNTGLFYQKLFNNCGIFDISPIIRKHRAIKSCYELQIIKEAAQMMDWVFNQIPEYLSPKSTEVQIAAEIERLARIAGHEGLIRMRGFNSELHYGQLFSGANAAVPSFFDGPTGGKGLSVTYPMGASKDTIQKNKPIVADYVAVKDGYMIDMTRVFALGEIDTFFIEAYDAAISIQDAVAKEAVPGAIGSKLYEKALQMAKDFGFQDFFMGAAPDQTSFVAHGVGLELDELPVLAKGYDIVLQENMVFALEPKFIFPNQGVVGIENTFVVKPEGSQCITQTSQDIHYIK